MTNWKLYMIAVLGIALTAVIRQWKSDFLPLVRIAFVCVFGFAAIGMIAPLISYLHLLETLSGAEEWISLPLKGLGIAFLTQVCADICRDSGEGGIASGVELVGKIEILLLCLPLLERILALARELLGVGG